MARNRQRAKERQARRKAREGGADGAPQPPRSEPPPVPAAPSGPADAGEGRERAREEIQLQAGAPPEDVGRSDEVLEYEQDLGADEEQEHFDPARDEPEEDLAPAGAGPRGRRGAERAQHKDRPRLVQFLYAVVAELKRVQWPDRPALTTLTGVVLGFVLIAGGYLGLLDAIFSRIIQAIL